MTDYFILTFKEAFYYILTQKPLESDGVTEFLSMLILSNLWFHLGIIYSAFISYLLTLFRSKKTLNTSAYKVISVIGFLICSITYLAFDNSHFGILLGIIVAPLLFDYNIYFRQEWIIKILGFIGIAFGFIFGLIICALFYPESHTSFYQLLAGIGAYVGWLLFYYPILYISKIFKSYNERKLKLEQKKLADEAKFKKDQENEQRRKNQAPFEQKRYVKQAELEKAKQEKIKQERWVELERKREDERAKLEGEKNLKLERERRAALQQKVQLENVRLDNEKKQNLEKVRQIEFERKRQIELAKLEQEKKLKLEQERQIEFDRKKQTELAKLQEEKKLKLEKERQTALEQKNRLVQARLNIEKKQNSHELKNNWQDFEEILKSKNITKFYHFTDRKNLDSIRKNGGLYSWWKAEELGIDIPMPGGIGFGRDLDKKHGLHNYVRLCFTKKHPMLFIAKQDKRIINPVFLEIKSDVAYLNSTRFSNMNATRNGHQQGSTLEDLKRIRFDLVSKPDQFYVSENERHYYQAEVLVLEKIPLEYITNINSV
jgi:hypothetical protein